MSADWLTHCAGGALLLRLHVQPGARKTEFCGPHGDALKVRLAAPPVEGRANAALVAFVAEYCGLARSAVRLVRGQASRAKQLRIDGADEAARAALARLAP